MLRMLMAVCFIGLLFTGCTKNQDCDDGDPYEYDFLLTLNDAENTVVIDWLDPDSDNDCIDYDYRMIVARLPFGAAGEAEVINAFRTQTIFDLTMDGPGSATLADLDETDDAANLQLYAVVLLKYPGSQGAAAYTASADFDQRSARNFYFGVYPGGDAPDLSPCSNCVDETCEDGSVATCGCFNGFCYCRLCPMWEVFS